MLLLGTSWRRLGYAFSTRLAAMHVYGVLHWFPLQPAGLCVYTCEQGYSGNESFNPDRFEFVLEHKQKLEDAFVKAVVAWREKPHDLAECQYKDAYAEFESSRVPQPLSRFRSFD